MASQIVGRTALLGGILAALLGCRSTSDNQDASSSPRPGPVSSSSTGFERPRRNQGEVQLQFTSYEEALRVVRSTYDCDVEDASRSSVVFGAEYCDAGEGQGYLIVNLRGREYIHAGVPEEVWEEFRDAESMGSYYSSNLRGQYRLALAP